VPRGLIVAMYLQTVAFRIFLARGRLWGCMQMSFGYGFRALILRQ